MEFTESEEQEKKIKKTEGKLTEPYRQFIWYNNVIGIPE